MIRLLLLIAAVFCAVWVVALLGPFTDWPGDPLQLLAASLAFGWAASLDDWRTRR